MCDEEYEYGNDPDAQNKDELELALEQGMTGDIEKWKVEQEVSDWKEEQ